MLKNNEVDIIIDEIDYTSENYVSFPTSKPLTSIFFTSARNEEISEQVDYNHLLNLPIYIVDSNVIGKNMKSKYSDFKYISVQSTAIMVNLIKSNHGIGFTQLELIKDELENRKLIELKTNIKLPSSQVYLTYIPNMKSHRIIAFADFVKEHTISQFNWIYHYY